MEDTPSQPQPSQIPDLVKIGSVATDTAINVQTDILDPDKGYPAQLKSCSGGKVRGQPDPAGPGQSEKHQPLCQRQPGSKQPAQPGRYSRRKPEIRRGVQRQGGCEGPSPFLW